MLKSKIQKKIILQKTLEHQLNEKLNPDEIEQKEIEKLSIHQNSPIIMDNFPLKLNIQAIRIYIRIQSELKAILFHFFCKLV